MRTVHRLTMIGAGIAVVDIIVDTYFLLDTMVGHASTGIYVAIALRALCYVALVPWTIALATRVSTTADPTARITLTVLMFGYVVGCVANYAASESIMVFLTVFEEWLGDGIAPQRSAAWVISAISDALQLLLALTIAVTLLAWGNRASASPQRSSVDSGV